MDWYYRIREINSPLLFFRKYYWCFNEIYTKGVHIIMQHIKAESGFGYYSRDDHEKAFDDFNRKVFLEGLNAVSGEPNRIGEPSKAKVMMCQHGMAQETLNLIRKLDDKIEALSKKIEEMES